MASDTHSLGSGAGSTLAAGSDAQGAFSVGGAGRRRGSWEVFVNTLQESLVQLGTRLRRRRGISKQTMAGLAVVELMRAWPNPIGRRFLYRLPNGPLLRSDAAPRRPPFRAAPPRRIALVCVLAWGPLPLATLCGVARHRRADCQLGHIWAHAPQRDRRPLPRNVPPRHTCMLCGRRTVLVHAARPCHLPFPTSSAQHHCQLLSPRSPHPHGHNAAAHHALCGERPHAGGSCGHGGRGVPACWLGRQLRQRLPRLLCAPRRHCASWRGRLGRVWPAARVEAQPGGLRRASAAPRPRARSRLPREALPRALRVQLRSAARRAEPGPPPPPSPTQVFMW